MPTRPFGVRCKPYDLPPLLANPTRLIMIRLLQIALLVCLTLGWVSTAIAQITPSKAWFAPSQPILFRNVGDTPVELVLTDFQGERIVLAEEREPVASVLAPGEEADLTVLYPSMHIGTYLLYPVKPGGATSAFTSTPYVIGVRFDDRPEAPPGPVVVKVEPLRYALLDTDAGPITVAFYYDVAPNTVDSFLSLAAGGFYDGLTFHRIVPGFVIQGGDPVGDGTGGPGYRIDAEFNDRPHLPGVVSMAREGDPIESQGELPRERARNSAGSQFFICLDYEQTRRLDGRYTVFGRVVEGMESVMKIGSSEIGDPATGRPTTPTVIRSVFVKTVEPDDESGNPYAKLITMDAPTTLPDAADESVVE